MSEPIIGLPSIFINKEAVNHLVNNYQNGKHQLLSDAMGKPETKSGWYSREQFEEMVREMNYHDASGIRMYFGAYNAQHPQYANQMTIIFVPTLFDADKNSHKDIIIDDTTVFEQRKAITLKVGENDIPKNLDTIGLCPPACAGQSSGYPLIEQ